MTLVGEFELVSYNFATGEIAMRRKVYDEAGKYEDTLTLLTRAPEFRGLNFVDGKRFVVTIEEVGNE